jgi:hemerythrin-like domain-containing protein
MTQPNQPNIVADLLRFHRMITRGLDVSIAEGQTFAREGYPDASTHEGYISYVRSLASVLNAHHLTEDELAFPRFRERLPDPPYEQLMAEHAEMVPVLDEIEAAAERAAAEAGPGPALDDLQHALTKVRDLWRPHIQKEEVHFTTEKAAELFSVDEHVAMAGQFAKFGQEHMGTDYLVVPFMLYNLAPEDRAVMSRAMPPVITQELVPIVWKDKWAPMKPFLLD